MGEAAKPNVTEVPNWPLQLYSKQSQIKTSIHTEMKLTFMENSSLSTPCAGYCVKQFRYFIWLGVDFITYTFGSISLWFYIHLNSSVFQIINTEALGVMFKHQIFPIMFTILFFLKMKIKLLYSSSIVNWVEGSFLIFNLSKIQITRGFLSPENHNKPVLLEG